MSASLPSPVRPRVGVQGRTFKRAGPAALGEVGPGPAKLDVRDGRPALQRTG
ncbi:MAG: hypothetical protein IT436_16755 [Phycisphaerales bacterium]|nr:hypothetical protein [Phycisphaerales bacterium]